MPYDVTLQGADYPAVPKIIVPKTGGGSASFFADISPFTIRPDAELVQTYTYDKKLVEDEKVTFPAYTTTSKTLIASKDLTPTVTLDYGTYDYRVLIRCLSIPTYSVTTKAKGRAEYSLAAAAYDIVEIPANLFATLIDPTKKVTSRTVGVYSAGNCVRLLYWSSGTAIAAYSTAAYGTAQTVTAPTVSSGVLTIKSPALIARGSTTYFTSTYMNAVTDVRYQYRIEVWRYPKGSLNLDGMMMKQQALFVLDCINNNNCVLL